MSRNVIRPAAAGVVLASPLALPPLLPGDPDPTQKCRPIGSYRYPLPGCAETRCKCVSSGPDPWNDGIRQVELMTSALGMFTLAAGLAPSNRVLSNVATGLDTGEVREATV